MEGSEEEEVDGSEAGGDSEDGDELKEPNGVEEMAEEEENTIPVSEAKFTLAFHANDLRVNDAITTEFYCHPILV